MSFGCTVSEGGCEDSFCAKNGRDVAVAVASAGVQLVISTVVTLCYYSLYCILSNKYYDV